MKNKFLLTVALASLVSAGAFAQETYELQVNRTATVAKAPKSVQADEYLIKNCSDEIAAGIGLRSNYTVRVFNKVPASTALLLKGNNLTKINYGLAKGQDTNETGISNVKVLVSEDPLGNNIISQSVEASDANEPGWHEVVLDTPYAISDKEFYIGYEADVTGGFYGIGADGETNGDFSTLLVFAQNTWQDGQWQADFGVASIYAVAEGDVVPDKSSLVLKSVSTLPYVKSGEEAKVNFTVANYGFDDVASINVTYGFEGEQATTEKVDVDLKKGASVPLSCTLVCSETGIVNKTIEITVAPVETEDVDMSDNTAKVSTCFYTEDALIDGQRKVLLEQFTTEVCPNCPRGDETISNTVAKYTNGEVIRVANHSGYYDDKLTLEYTEAICYYFFNAPYSYAPACMVDRKFREGYPGSGGSATGPIFGVSADYIKKAIDEDLAAPLFASVDLVTEYDKDTRTLDINVSGKCLIPFENLRLNVIMTEDGIAGNQAGSGSGWKHYHAVRATLTDNAGVTVELDADGNYSYHTTYRIPTSISGTKNTPVSVNSEKINIVAFLCEMPLDDANACEVLNAEIAEKPAAPTSIKDVNGENMVVYAEDGYLVIDGEFDAAEVYGVNGMLVKNVNAGEKVTSVSDLNAGVYMVKVMAGGQSSVAKVVVTK